jgi:DNA-binding HxlR family transcriptional regulator
MTDYSALESLLKMLSARWSLTILLTIRQAEVCSYNDLLTNIGSISHKMLSTRLKQLLARQLISRNVIETIPLRVVYSLTSKGKTLLTSLDVFAKTSLDDAFKSE